MTFGWLSLFLGSLALGINKPVHQPLSIMLREDQEVRVSVSWTHSASWLMGRWVVQNIVARESSIKIRGRRVKKCQNWKAWYQNVFVDQDILAFCFGFPRSHRFRPSTDKRTRRRMGDSSVNKEIFWMALVITQKLVALLT
jgi:hypothetical protein